MSDLDREVVILVVVGAIVLDSLFLGVIETLLLALFGRGGWYATLVGGERIVYQGRHGVLFSGISFALPNRVVVSDKRLAVTIAWSRAAFVIVPVAALLSVTPGTWWWHATVQVEFLERDRRRSVSILVSRATQTGLVTALQSVAPASIQSRVPSRGTA
jgi:hypothetical protein